MERLRLLEDDDEKLQVPCLRMGMGERGRNTVYRALSLLIQNSDILKLSVLDLWVRTTTLSVQKPISF